MVYEEWETTWETVKRRGVEKEAVLPDPCLHGCVCNKHLCPPPPHAVDDAAEWGRVSRLTRSSASASENIIAKRRSSSSSGTTMRKCLQRR